MSRPGPKPMFPWTRPLLKVQHLCPLCRISHLYLCLSFIYYNNFCFFISTCYSFVKIHLILLAQYLIWGHIDRVYLIHLGLCLLETTVAGEIGRSGRCAPLTLWGSSVCGSIRGRPDGRGDGLRSHIFWPFSAPLALQRAYSETY